MIGFYEKGIRVGITRAILHHMETNNKYMYDYDKSKKCIQFKS